MRSTPLILIVLGLTLMVSVLLTINAGVISEGLDLSVRNAARDISERMDRTEIVRVFEMREDEAAPREWLERRFGRPWSSSMRGFAPLVIVLQLVVGVSLVALGFAERSARKHLQTTFAPSGVQS